jgi:4-hydroxy-3-polyprenylbenzoate decarboxylase
MGLYTVVITGASGSVYGLRLIEQLVSSDNDVAVVVTNAGRQVMAAETGLDMPEREGERKLSQFLGIEPHSKLRIATREDLFDALASGSHRVDGMVVVPASMGFCGAIASGIAEDLPTRAAAVMLKEHRKLVIVPRETPLSLVNLRNLTTLAEAGAVILPAMPAFYAKPRSLDDAVNFVVGKILDVLGVEHELFRRWGE